MNPLPKDPLALQARVMTALLGDIADVGSPTFKRLDALRQVQQTTRERGDGNALPEIR